MLRHAVNVLAAGARLAEPAGHPAAYLNGRIDCRRRSRARPDRRYYALWRKLRQWQADPFLADRPSQRQLLELIALLEAGIDFARTT